MTITPIEEMQDKLYMKGLSDPIKCPGVIVGSFNPSSRTFIYHYGDYRLWLKPFERIWVVWRNEKFCFSFERETLITDMIERMDNYGKANNN